MGTSRRLVLVARRNKKLENNDDHYITILCCLNLKEAYVHKKESRYIYLGAVNHHILINVISLAEKDDFKYSFFDKQFLSYKSFPSLDNKPSVHDHRQVDSIETVRLNLALLDNVVRKEFCMPYLLGIGWRLYQRKCLR